MIPIVKYGEVGAAQKAEGKKRKRRCFWKEFRLSAASRPGEEKTCYRLTDGSPYEAGCMMVQTTKSEVVVTELGALHQQHPQKEAVEDCHRYLGNRTAHLRYAKELQAGCRWLGASG